MTRDPMQAGLLQTSLLQASLLQAMARLEHILVAENTTLAGDASRLDWALANARKQHATYELQRLMRQSGAADALAGHDTRVLRLRGLAQANAQFLSCHMQAGRDICDRLAAVIREAEWDGTYGPRASTGRSR